MSYSITSQVTEIKMVYQNRIKAANRPQIRNSEDAYKILAEHWSEQIGLIEEFVILLLDRSNRVLGRQLISIGGISGTVVDPKILFACALKCRASSVILSHNHPSGNLHPSKADIALTNKLKQGGNILDIAILDHLILSPEGGFFSFADEGLM
ncbi:MAG: DNA repair protein [Bacteroidetes bacterium]|nr:MAG: DNA repair protein [Bacteroidota bacterium]